MSFRNAETHGWQTDSRPVRGASRNVRAGERVEDIGKRTRYYQSMIDMDSLLKGAVYSELKESYVIFICTSDPFESGLPAYTFERKCREDAGVELKDETHHLIFNASAYEQENDPELRDFLSFVKNNTAGSELHRQNFTKAYE